MQPTTDFSSSGASSTLSRYQRLLLVVILLVGGALRMYNIAWDGGTLPHPDERSTLAFYALSIRWPKDSSALFDPRRSTLNPFWDVEGDHRRSYTYGHFPLYTLVLTASAAEELAPLAERAGFPEDWVQTLADARSLEGYAHLGRFLVALSDTVTIYLIFLLGRRVYGIWAGLLAAAFSAFTVLQIQLAHFFAVDPISATFTFLALYGSIRLYDRQKAGSAILTGLGIGLAVASKYSALPIVAAPLVAAVLSVVRADPAEQATVRRLAVRNLVIAGLVSFAAFAVTSPFVFLDFESFWRAVVVEQGNMVGGIVDLPFTRQYRGTLAYVYFLEQQLKWGMGWPLGLLALAGLAWVLIRAILGKARPGEWILLSWVVLYFGPTGLFLAKFMRYMVPVVPLFVLFGAGLLSNIKVQISNIESENQPVLTRRALIRSVIAGVVLLGAIIWALAFVNGVYGTEHSWVTASRWVYQNIPDGACIAQEHWEEGFPRSWPEPGMSPASHRYRQPLLPMYEEDTRAKFETIRDTLRDCDYLVLASNRLWRTIPRLPARYPMSTRYYQALFDGELGFEQVYTHATPPRLGPLVFDDQNADESFTVYDHPRPIIFKKTRQLSDAEWEAVLGNEWWTAVHGYVGPPTLLMRLRGWDADDPKSQLPKPQPKDLTQRKSLMLNRPVDELPVVDDYHWNGLANRSALVAIGFWWLAVQVIGWLAWPLARRLLGGLPDRGYLLAKSLGWLLVGYAVWLASSLRLLPNRLPTIIGAVVVLAAIAVWLERRDGWRVGDLIRSQWRLLLVGEIVFGLAYLYFVGLRLLNPDLWQPWNGGEKMLEIGFLNAIVKSAHMPPYDPYFAGGYINYYYYGLFLVGTLVKLTGIQPTIAFNLAVPTLGALTAANVFSLGYNLACRTGVQRRLSTDSVLRALAVAALAVLLVVGVGNLEGFNQWVEMLAEHGGSTFESGMPRLQMAVRALTGLQRTLFEGARLPAYNYWDPSRVIANTINEFPYWSFLFADLHPHMIGIPFTVLFLSLAYAWLMDSRDTAPSAPLVSSILRWLALPLCLGALAAINTWDLPTYLGVITLTFWLTRYRRSAREGQRPSAARLIWHTAEALVFGGLILGMTYLFYLPFFAHYQPLDVGLGIVRDKTDWGEFVLMWGVFLFLTISYLVVSLIHPRTRIGALRSISLFLRRWNVIPHLAEVYGALVRRLGAVNWAILGSLVVVAGVAVILWLSDYRVPGLLLSLMWLAFLFLLRPEPDAGRTFVGLLLFTGLLVLLGVEFFFLRDFLGGSDYYRMNTLFKFYIQVWVMLGVAAAYVLVDVWASGGDALSSQTRWQIVLRSAWQGVVTLLILAAMVYPLMGTRTRVLDRFDRSPPIGTLDGIAYMTAGTLVWPQDNPMQLKYDYDAIRWLQENVTGTPVLAEARIGYYREGGMRVSSYTGLPTPLGGLHQNEQRWPDQVGQRDQQVMAFWTTDDPQRAWELIRELDISYIYIGQLERTFFNPELSGTLGQWGIPSFAPGGLTKFDALLDQGRLSIAYQNERTQIYRVVSQ